MEYHILTSSSAHALHYENQFRDHPPAGFRIGDKIWLPFSKNLDWIKVCVSWYSLYYNFGICLVDKTNLGRRTGDGYSTECGTK